MKESQLRAISYAAADRRAAQRLEAIKAAGLWYELRAYMAAHRGSYNEKIARFCRAHKIG